MEAMELTRVYSASTRLVCKYKLRFSSLVLCNFSPGGRQTSHVQRRSARSSVKFPTSSPFTSSSSHPHLRFLSKACDAAFFEQVNRESESSQADGLADDHQVLQGGEEQEDNAVNEREMAVKDP
mmetsp:Transcript_18399/g.60417  ORF Transcript_18399/g.60417 Transcript_18399/m.60417 type:complete len:124 (+) Transcript_18399:154-525(+)